MSEKEKPFFTPEQRKLARKIFCKDLNEEQADHFLTICERQKLDPFARQIFARAQNVNRGTVENAKWEKELVVITSIDGLRSIAASSGEYRGQIPAMWYCRNDATGEYQWQDVWTDTFPKSPWAAKAGVLREGFPEPLISVARWESYVQFVGRGKEKSPTSFWRRMPDVMLAKCAEAGALRKAFPQLLSGVYIEEEIGAQHQSEESGEPATEGQSLTEQLVAEGAQVVPGQKMTPATAQKPASGAQETAVGQKKARKGKGSQKAAEAATEPQNAPPVEKEPASDPIQEEKQDAAPAATGQEWENHVLDFPKVKGIQGQKLGNLSLEQLEKIYNGWVVTYAEKIATEPAKQVAATMITKAYEYRKANAAS